MKYDAEANTFKDAEGQKYTSITEIIEHYTGRFDRDWAHVARELIQKKAGKNNPLEQEQVQELLKSTMAKHAELEILRSKIKATIRAIVRDEPVPFQPANAVEKTLFSGAWRLVKQLKDLTPKPALIVADQVFFSRSYGVAGVADIMVYEPEKLLVSLYVIEVASDMNQERTHEFDFLKHMPNNRASRAALRLSMLERLMVSGGYVEALPGLCNGVCASIYHCHPITGERAWITPEEKKLECAEMLLDRITSEIPF